MQCHCKLTWWWYAESELESNRLLNTKNCAQIAAAPIYI